MQLAPRIFEAADLEAAVELCFQNNWTDGLPVVPPRNGVATIEKIAINSAMAGCKPEYVPIVIAAVEAMLQERFNLNGVQTTTHACAPLCMVSGPA